MVLYECVANVIYNVSIIVLKQKKTLILYSTDNFILPSPIMLL